MGSCSVKVKRPPLWMTLSMLLVSVNCTRNVSSQEILCEQPWKLFALMGESSSCP